MNLGADVFTKDGVMVGKVKKLYKYHFTMRNLYSNDTILIPNNAIWGIEKGSTEAGSSYLLYINTRVFDNDRTEPKKEHSFPDKKYLIDVEDKYYNVITYFPPNNTKTNNNNNNMLE